MYVNFLVVPLCSVQIPITLLTTLLFQQILPVRSEGLGTLVYL